MDSNVETLVAIKELTTHLLYLGVGVFALVGGYLSIGAERIRAKGWLTCSLFFFGVSLLAGLFLFMRLIDLLQRDKFDPIDTWLRWCSIIQIVTVALGCVAFFVYMFRSISGRR